MSSPASRLALGTVQFGLDYGISNKKGKVSFREASEIVRVARRAGIDTLDTAAAYGDSESVLGTLSVSEWRVVSKLPALPGKVANVGDWVERTTLDSLQRMAISRLYGLLLHRAADLSRPDGDEIFAAIAALKERGAIARWGVSVYGPEDLDQLCGRYDFELVQAPFSIFDRRIESSGWLVRLKSAGIEVHTRSAYLQGLLLMSESARPIYFDRWQPIWRRWHSWLSTTGVSPVQACLGFVLSRPDVDRVVVGFDSVAQLEEAIIAAGRGSPLPPDDLHSEDVDLVNPSRWLKS